MTIRRRLLAAVLLPTSLVAGGLSAASPAAAGPRTPSFLVSAASTGVASESHEFALESFSPRGSLILAGSADGVDPIAVDGFVSASVQHGDGTYDMFSLSSGDGDCADAGPSIPPTNIGRYVKRGLNRLYIAVYLCGPSVAHGDIFLEGTSFLANDVLPRLDAGTFIHTQWAGAGGGTNDCTAGFTFPYFGGGDKKEPTSAASSNEGSYGYVVTAKHCFKAEGDGSTTADNAFLTTHTPVRVFTENARPKGRFDPATALSISALDTTCTDSIGGGCFGPDAGDGTLKDFVLVAVDNQISPMVQTAKGLLPVVGRVDPLPGDTVCHYGFGAFYARGGVKHAENCGAVSSVKASNQLCRSGGIPDVPPGNCPPNVRVFGAAGYGGDSGGPAYEYVTTSTGRVVGVLAAGIVVDANGADTSVLVTASSIEDAAGLSLYTTSVSA